MQFRPCLAIVALVVSAANGGVISTLLAGCLFYLAPTRARGSLGSGTISTGTMVTLSSAARGCSGSGRRCHLCGGSGFLDSWIS
jgi:hypothetical protein